MSGRQQLEQRLRQLEDQIQTCGFFESEEEAEAAHQERDRIREELAGLPAEPAPIAEVQVSELRATPGQDITWKSATLGRLVGFFELEQLTPAEAQLLYSELLGGLVQRGKSLGRATRPDERERLEQERGILAAMVSRLQAARSTVISAGERQQLEQLRAGLSKLKAENKQLRKLLDFAALAQERESMRGQLRSVAQLISDIHAVADEQALESCFMEAAYEDLSAEQFAALMGTAARSFSRRRLQRLARFTELAGQALPHLDAAIAIARGAEQRPAPPDPEE